MTEELKHEEIIDPIEDTVVEEEAAEEAMPEKGAKKKMRALEAALLEKEKEVKKLSDDLASLNDTYLRLAAEYDNFRRRTAKEREGIYTDAFGEALNVLFPVVDNLERAAQYSDGENVAKGVELTLKSVRDTFAKLGVTEIDPVGEVFDPNFHNAVMHVEDDTVGESVVVEVLQKGYCRGDRVLRYAMVKVAN
ncbi:MAG: nucleotide exchange factor GrpE [Ruminococcaceae bacterium]|nr:nucleotide exchange factor GrpE [Oscillospiraceae bacterium]